MYQRLLARRDARRNESGFTLIELLIVIVILGVLAAIVVFSVRGITDRGDKAACQAERNTLEVAVEAYYAKKTPAAYPTAMTDLTSGADQLLRSTPKYWELDGTAGAIKKTAAGAAVSGC